MRRRPALSKLGTVAATAWCAVALVPVLGPASAIGAMPSADTAPGPAAHIAAAELHACGTIRGGTWKVSGAGHISCAQARGVAAEYLNGHGTLHGPSHGPRSAQYLTLPGGWRCSVLAYGAADCSRAATARSPAAVVGFVKASAHTFARRDDGTAA